eukprot:GHVR01001813.1.p1 GENE.GHVR01001813.1~~GHVR01001813.1.p1  ORF type:complete len:133 (+),score=20.23 GHVR01001813.1:65-463(+)
MVVIELKSVDISPNECLVESGINIGLSFTCIEDIFNAYWSFSYIVDTVHSRKIVKLGDSPSFQYNRNEVHSTTWSCERIDLKGVTEEVLNNVGLVVGSLKSQGEVVCDVNMVTEVYRGSGGELMRRVFNPLD